MIKLPLAAIGVLYVATMLAAQDLVIVRTANGSRIGIACIIQDYTGRELTYQQKPDGPVRRMPRRDVMEVITPYTEDHLEGLKQLARGAAKPAFEKLTAALEEEDRIWVRREILAAQIRCALWGGDRMTAGEKFSALFDSDPETMFFPLIPLSWSDRPPTAELAKISKQWLSTQGNAVLRLMGASHLLAEPSQAESMQPVLKQLARDDNPEIHRFAQYQIWRARVLSGEMPRDELLRWERTFDDAGESAGGGPRYLIGMAYHRQHDDLAAAASWLYLPFVAGDDRELAARAGWNAVRSLERAGDEAAAAALKSEFADRYGDLRETGPAKDQRQGSPDSGRRDTTKP